MFLHVYCVTSLCTHTESLLDELGLVSLFSLSLFRGTFLRFSLGPLCFSFIFFMLHVFSWLFCFGYHVLTGKSPKRPIIC